MSDTIQKLQELISSSQLTEEEIQKFYQEKLSQIDWQRKNLFKNEFDKIIQEQVYKQVNSLISSTEIYPVVEKIMENRINQIVEERLRAKISSIVSSNITKELEEMIKETVQKKINNLVAIDEEELYQLQNNQKED